MEDLIREYQLSYSLMLAEQEMFDSILEQEVQFTLNDTIDSRILTEGVKETVMNYLQKVIGQLQKVWVKFSKTISEKLSPKIADQLEKSIAKNKGKIDFAVSYYGEMDLGKMFSDQFALKEWQYQEYQQNKDSYKSKTEYMSKYYPTLLPDNNNEGRNLKKCMIDNIVTQHQGFKVTDTVLAEMLDFLKNGYKEAVSNLEAEINVINNSSKNISTAVNTIMNAEETANTNEAFAFLESVYLDLFTEAEEPENAQKMTFTDTSGETTSDDKKATKDINGFTRDTAVYMGVAMNIISAKMSIINRAASDRMKILMHYNTAMKGNKTAVANDNKGTANPTNASNVVPQVNTNVKK